MTDWISAPVSPDALDRVRHGVRARIARRRALRHASAPAAAAAAIALLLWPSPPPLESLTLPMPPGPSAPVWIPPAPSQPPTIQVRALSRPADRITIYTSDPDVVIVLVAEGGEE